MSDISNLHWNTAFMFIEDTSRDDSVNSLRPWQNGRYFTDDNCKLIFLNKNCSILIYIDNKPSLVQIMAYSEYDRALSESMRAYWPQWVNLCVIHLGHHRFELNITLQWRHNGRDGVSNHQPHDCLLNRLFRRRSKKTSKLRVTGLCAGNSPGTSEFPTQMASNAENGSIWWRHHDSLIGTHHHLQKWWFNVSKNCLKLQYW